MLRVFWLTFVLALASATVRAQPAQAPNISAVTEQARNAAASADQRVAQLSVQRSQLAQRYQDELAAIDRLKLDKGWRRERELRAKLSDSADTAKQLQTVTRDLTAAQQSLQASRAALLSAIDAELAANVLGPRAQALAKLRSQLAPQLGTAPKKIVIPDAEIDPLADPEELEQQAAAIRSSEDQLARQVIGLETQVKDLKEVDDLRRQHQRATDLALRDDDQPHRDGQRSTSRDSAAPSTFAGTSGGAGQGSGAGTGGADTTLPPVTPSSFESQLTVTLGDVIDHSTIEGLLRASRSGDPAKRAEAAQQARDAVAARLAQLKKKRAAIEARAKSLRGR